MSAETAADLRPIILSKSLIKLTKFRCGIMNKIQIPLDCGMPKYRAHLAGTAALVVEFGAQINRQFCARDFALGQQPAEVCQDYFAHAGIASAAEVAG
jgi:hypothetical protein